MGSQVRTQEDIDDDDDDQLTGQIPTQKQMNANMGCRHHYPGPVCCEFNGITIPDLVFVSRVVVSHQRYSSSL